MPEAPTSRMNFTPFMPLCQEPLVKEKGKPERKRDAAVNSS
jgi:hypothetical protein